MNILLGLTGSVATKIAPRIIEALETVPNCTEVRVIMTDKARMFQDPSDLSRKSGVRVYTEQHEWTWKKTVKSEAGDHIRETETCRWEKDFPILHIDLSKWASIMVIAPCTANTLSKLANGQCDNLLTCTYTALNPWTMVIIAPAMNPRMLGSHATRINLGRMLELNNITIINPITKTLACGDTGMGAMALTTTIAEATSKSLQWHFPLPHNSCPGIPTGNHPGAFGAMRKHDRHCGVDLYCEEGTPVLAVENGEVTVVEDFTGEKAGCPWWMDTKCVKVAGASGTICYGEIIPDHDVIPGRTITRGSRLGKVTPVIKPGRERPDIPGHSRSMLHLQVYTRGTTHKDMDWGIDTEMPENVIDPTGDLTTSNPGMPKLEMTSGTNEKS